MADRKDITDTPFSITLRTAVVVVVALSGIVSSGAHALYQLNSKIDAAVSTASRALANTQAMECDVADIRNFMIYKRVPDDQCRQLVRRAQAAAPL